MKFRRIIALVLGVMLIASSSIVNAQVVGPNSFLFSGLGSNVWACTGGQSSFQLSVPAGLTGTFTVTVGQTSTTATTNPPAAYAPGSPAYTNTISGSGSLTVQLASNSYVKVAVTSYTSGSTTVQGTCSAASASAPAQPCATGPNGGCTTEQASGAQNNNRQCDPTTTTRCMPIDSNLNGRYKLCDNSTNVCLGLVNVPGLSGLGFPSNILPVWAFDSCLYNTGTFTFTSGNSYAIQCDSAGGVLTNQTQGKPGFMTMTNGGHNASVDGNGNTRGRVCDPVANRCSTVDPTQNLNAAPAYLPSTILTSSSPTSCTAISSTATVFVSITNVGAATTIFPRFFDNGAGTCNSGQRIWGDGTSITLAAAQTITLNIPLANGLSYLLSGALSDNLVVVTR